MRLVELNKLRLEFRRVALTGLPCQGPLFPGVFLPVGFVFQIEERVGGNER